MSYCILTKRINASVIINGYMIQLTKFHELDICEVITQQLRSNHTNILYEGILTTKGDYELYDYTNYTLHD